MLPRLLTNIILLVIVLTLGVFIYISRNDNDIDTRLTRVDPGSIMQINIKHNAREVVLEQTDGHWRMLKPSALDANDFRIKSLLDMLSTQSFSSYALDEVELDKLGLAAAVTKIRFDELEIVFGRDNPINHQRYVLVNDRVHLIGDQFHPLISSQTGTLISQYMLPRGAVITGIDLPEQTLRKSDIGWQSSDISVSTDDITKTIGHWNQSQAFGVHTYYPRKSLGRIEVSIDGEDAALVFEVTDTEPWLIIARPALDIEYHFNLEFYNRLLRPGADAGAEESLPDDVIQEAIEPAALLSN